MAISRKIRPKKIVKLLQRNPFKKLAGKGFKNLGPSAEIVVGRPALAKRIIAKETNPEIRNKLIVLAELPFVSKELIEAMWPDTILLKDRDLRKIQRFRCSSREEIDAVRLALKSSNHTIRRRALKMIDDILNKKKKIIDSALIEPELTSLVFKNFFEHGDIDPSLINSAVNFVKKTSECGYGQIEFNLVDEKTERKTHVKLKFERSQSGGWNVKKS